MSAGLTWLKRAQAQGWLPDDWVPENDSEPSPLLAALVFLGALLCSVPLLAFLGLGLGEVLMRSSAGYVVGVAGVVAAVWLLRSTRHIFTTCMALELWGLGIALVLVRWLDDANGDEIAMLSASAFFTAVLMGSARVTAALWVVRLMGMALTGALMATLMLGLYVVVEPGELVWMLSAMGLPLLALAWGWWCWNESRWVGQPGAARQAALADGFAVGLVLCELALRTWWYMPMHLFSESLGGADQAWGWLWALQRGVALILVLGSGWALRRRWVSVTSARKAWQPLLGLVWMALALAAWFSPGIGTIAVVAAMAAASARWRLLVACGLAGLALLSGFYYNLAWTLVAKGLGLMLMGAVMAAALALLALRARRHPGYAPAVAHSRQGMAWVLLGGVMALGLANADVWRKESVIAKGQRILVPLVPVDPRSLMQGDYMQLRFAIPQPMLDTLRESTTYSVSKNARAVARLNARGEAELLRLAQPAEKPGEGEILLPLKQLKGQWVLVTDAYFFPEGEGARFEKARFGEFRALPDGRALLVGLADADGRGIPAHQDK